MIDIKKKLRDGLPTIGTWMQLPCPNVAEIMGQAGYDWVAIDLEHGGFSRRDLADIFRALELGSTMPFARVAKGQPQDIKQALDAGARGIILPMVENGTQLKNCITWAHYPSKGSRGVGYSRANLFGKKFDTYRQDISTEIVIVAQIEHINAVIALDDILDCHGLDAIMIGPYDLSGSMGLTAQFEHPDFVEALTKIFNKAKLKNIPMGIHIVQPDTEELNAKISAGYQFIAYGVDSVFLYNSAEKPKTL